MSDIEGGQEYSLEPQEPTEAPEQVENHSTEQQAPSNPFWGEVEKVVGPNVWKTIQPHLTKADAEANRRIAAVNESFKPWKAFADQGITPENAQQAFDYVKQINTPEGQVEIYTALRTFLEREGRLPESPQELQEEVENNEEEDPRDAQIQAMQAQLQQLGQYTMGQFQGQAQQQAAYEADQWLDSENTRLQQQGYDEDDIKEIVRIAAFQAQQTGQDPENLDAAAAQFAALRDRIRTAPRPSQQAPRLPSGPGGGSPQGPTIDPSKLTRQQRIELATQTLQRGQ